MKVLVVYNSLCSESARNFSKANQELFQTLRTYKVPFSQPNKFSLLIPDSELEYHYFDTAKRNVIEFIKKNPIHDIIVSFNTEVPSGIMGQIQRALFSGALQETFWAKQPEITVYSLNFNGVEPSVIHSRKFVPGFHYRTQNEAYQALESVVQRRLDANRRQVQKDEILLKKIEKELNHNS